MTPDKLAELLAIPKLPTYIDQVNEALVATVTASSPTLCEPALRLIKSGGKRLRPVLVIASAKAGDGTINQSVIDCAVAVELTHLATLAHDDIMDSAATRHGQPATHVQVGINNAILVGDYLLALSAAQAASMGAEAAHIISTTVTRLCDGQSQELSDNYNPDRTVEAYLTATSNKTASLLSAACRLGGVCAKLPTAKVEALAAYGQTFGMGFQLMDDLLDFVATSERLGKPAGNDLKTGTYTLPLLLVLQNPAYTQVRTWLGSDPAAHPSRQAIIDVLSQSGALAQTVAEIKKYHTQAAEIAQGIGETRVTSGLARLPVLYGHAAMQKQSVISNSDWT